MPSSPRSSSSSRNPKSTRKKSQQPSYAKNTPSFSTFLKGRSYVLGGLVFLARRIQRDLFTRHKNVAIEILKIIWKSILLKSEHVQTGRSWRRHFEIKTCDRFRLETIITLKRNRSQVFTSKCGPSAMSSSPRSSSSSRYHEVNMKEVSRMSWLTDLRNNILKYWIRNYANDVEARFYLKFQVDYPKIDF